MWRMGSVVAREVTSLRGLKLTYVAAGEALGS